MSPCPVQRDNARQTPPGTTPRSPAAFHRILHRQPCSTSSPIVPPRRRQTQRHQRQKDRRWIEKPRDIVQLPKNGLHQHQQPHSTTIQPPTAPPEKRQTHRRHHQPQVMPRPMAWRTDARRRVETEIPTFSMNRSTSPRNVGRRLRHAPQTLSLFPQMRTSPQPCVTTYHKTNNTPNAPAVAAPTTRSRHAVSSTPAPPIHPDSDSDHAADHPHGVIVRRRRQRTKQPRPDRSRSRFSCR